ncbi:MAG: phosphosulfolactate synthase, partial [Clostridia bacterium]|nr:phosphosulfolactate synthase [Clostridia bacterium]
MEEGWFDLIAAPVPGRTQKPRQTGLTMVMDKGLGLSQTREL